MAMSPVSLCEPPYNLISVGYGNVCVAMQGSLRIIILRKFSWW
uniref:Uncharacterized protein n=1 Tax=Rhizophora mucronata TaxID=61149 RepID=A0A2P2JVF6_RHIMU